MPRQHPFHASRDRRGYRGQALMREFLSDLVASTDFLDDARPGFLINPFTGERMEYDRYYFKAGRRL